MTIIEGLKFKYYVIFYVYNCVNHFICVVKRNFEDRYAKKYLLRTGTFKFFIIKHIQICCYVQSIYYTVSMYIFSFSSWYWAPDTVHSLNLSFFSKLFVCMTGVKFWQRTFFIKIITTIVHINSNLSSKLYFPVAE